MSLKAAIISLAVAAGVGVTTVAVVREQPKQPAAEASWLSGMRADGLRALRVKWPDGGSARLAPAEGVWLLEFGAGADRVSWPVAEERVRAGVRLMADVGQGLIIEEDPGSPRPLVTVGFELPDGSERRVVMSDSGLGRGLAATDEAKGRRYRFVDMSLVDMFARSGLEAWRDASAFPGAAGQVSRVSVSGQGREVTLRRARGRWGIETPVSTAAEPESAQGLAARLPGLTLKRVLRPSEMASAGVNFDAPNGFVTAESEVRRVEGGEVVERLLRQTMAIGGPADNAFKTVFVRCQAEWVDLRTSEASPAWGPIVGVVDREALAPLNAHAEVYAAKTVVQAPEADVGRVEVLAPGREAVVYERSGGSWTVQGRPASATEAARIAALVSLLARENAAVNAFAAPEGYEGGAEIRAMTAGGTPLAFVKVGSTAMKGEAALVLESDGVWRTYAVNATVRTAAPLLADDAGAS